MTSEAEAARVASLSEQADALSEALYRQLAAKDRPPTVKVHKLLPLVERAFWRAVRRRRALEILRP